MEEIAIASNVIIKAYDAKGHVNQTILIRAVYGYTITNSTNAKRTYTGYADVSTDDQHQEEQITFALNPGESRTLNNRTILFRYLAKRPETFKIIARVKIVNETLIYEANSRGTLTVTM